MRFSIWEQIRQKAAIIRFTAKRWAAGGGPPARRILGIAICGTGVGISLAANKVKGIRACVCSEPYTAKLSRMHNNSNVLAFGARVVGSELAKMIVDQWLDAEFEGGRHHAPGGYDHGNRKEGVIRL